MINFKDCIWKEGFYWKFDLENFKKWLKLNSISYSSITNLFKEKNITSPKIHKEMKSLGFNANDYTWSKRRYPKSKELDYMKSLEGVKFNKWIILEYLGKIKPKQRKYNVFECLCRNCNETISEIRYSDIIRNKTYQCRSCHVGKNNKDTKRKKNKYEVVGDNVKIFYQDYYAIIDKKYKNKVLTNYWCVNNGGYFTGRIRDKDRNIELHRYIMYLNGDINLEDKLLIDHINHNRRDNRYSNLRVATKSQNCSYRDYKSHNGIIGVTYKDGKWVARLSSGDDNMIKYFLKKNKAIKQRLIWERELLKEFAPQRHLFGKYGVGIDE